MGRSQLRGGVALYPLADGQQFCDHCGRAVDRLVGKCVSCGKLVCSSCAKLNREGTKVYCPDHAPKSLCFIATAAYGTPFAKEIDVLREFRDSRLMPRPAGRRFVYLYYATSPPIANIIASSDKLKAFVRRCLRPIVDHLERR